MSVKEQTETKEHASELLTAFSKQLQFCSYVVLGIYGSIAGSIFIATHKIENSGTCYTAFDFLSRTFTITKLTKQ